MGRFTEGEVRSQRVLFLERLDDYISEDNTVRAIDVFVDELDLLALGFDGMEPEATGRAAYHPATLLRIYIYGYLNRIQSSRRLERESHRNIELVWLTGRLSPDLKTITDFRKDNGRAIQQVCTQFVAPCRRLKLFSEALVAIDSSKFKAVNNRDRAVTKGKLQGRMRQLEESIGRYLEELDRADRQPSGEQVLKCQQSGSIARQVNAPFIASAPSRTTDTQLLVIGVFSMPHQMKLHDQRLSAYRPIHEAVIDAMQKRLDLSARSTRLVLR